MTEERTCAVQRERTETCESCVREGTNPPEEMCAHCRKKVRTEAEYKDMITRLNRIEGQVRGIKKMVEKDAYCVDIFTQVSAVQAALTSFNRKLLASHLRTCVVEDMKNGREEEAIEELTGIFQKLM